MLISFKVKNGIRLVEHSRITAIEPNKVGCELEVLGRPTPMMIYEPLEDVVKAVRQAHRTECNDLGQAIETYCNPRWNRDRSP